MKKLILILLILITLTSCNDMICQQLISQRQAIIENYNYRKANKLSVDSAFTYDMTKQTDSLIIKYCNCNEAE